MKNNPLTKLITALSLAGIGLLPQVVQAQAQDLLDVYQMARVQDAKMAQAQAQFDSDKQILDLVSSPLLPQVSLRGSVTKNESSSDFSDTTTSNVSLVIDQSLYSHEVWSRYEQADHQFSTAEYALRIAEQDLILRVSQAYFKVLLAYEDVTLTKAQETANKTQWDRAKASAEVGLASRTDVLQAKSSYDLSISDRINAENSLDVALEEIMQLTGKSIATLKRLGLDVNLPLSEFKLADWEQKAQANNLSVLTLNEQAHIASKNIEVQKSGYWPTVNLQATAGKTNYLDAPDTAQFESKSDLSISLNASINLYSGGATQTQVSQARAAYRAATLALRDAREQTRLQTRVLVRNVEKGYELILALQAAVQSSDAFLEAAEEGYKVGLKSLLEVLSARTNLYEARRNLASAIQNVIVNKLTLESTVGDLTLDDLAQYNQLLTLKQD